LLAEPLRAQRLEGPELIERMQWRALNVLGEAVLFRVGGCVGVSDHAGNWRGLRKALLFDEKLQGTVAAPSGRHLVHAGLVATLVELRTDGEPLEQGAPRDVLGELLDREAGF